MADLDIILATHNHLDLTIQCINALYANTTKSFRLIIVDDSTDLTPVYIQSLIDLGKDIKYIHSDTPYTHGNQIINAGLEQAETDIIAYIGNSVRVEPSWLDVAWDVMRGDNHIGIMGFKLLFPDNGLIEHAGIYWMPGMPHHVNFGVGEPSHRHSVIREVDIVGWALVLLCRDAFRDPLDTTTYIGFRGYDDVDNCLEAKKRGWKVLYCGVGVAYHQAGATRHDTKEIEKLNKEYEQNRLTFINKWGGVASEQSSTDSLR